MESTTAPFRQALARNNTHCLEELSNQNLKPQRILSDVFHFNAAQNSATVFLLRNKGNAMTPAIQDGDLVVVDKSIQPKHLDIVLVQADDSFMVRRYYQQDSFLSLQPDNPDYSALLLENEIHLEIWGVVTSVIQERA